MCRHMAHLGETKLYIFKSWVCIYMHLVMPNPMAYCINIKKIKVYGLRYLFEEINGVTL